MPEPVNLDEPGAIVRLNELRQKRAETEAREALREERMADLLEACMDYVPNGLADEIREVLNDE